MSTPVRADERQWILRRSSPIRYSRVDWSSAPCVPTEWLPALAPLPSHPGGSTGGPGGCDGRQWIDPRRYDELAGRGERPGHVDEPERVAQPDPQRSDPVAAAAQPGHAVGHGARLVAAERIQHEAGAADQSLR